MRWLGIGLLLSCSSSSTPPAFCAGDPGVETFQAGMVSKGVAGASVAIAGATPSVVQQGLNEWTITVHDATGAPVDGAVTVTPYMPAHQHGSPTVATITPKGSGTYDIAGINLAMRGVWTITITVKSATLTDTATFTFCVDGSS